MAAGGVIGTALFAFGFFIFLGFLVLFLVLYIYCALALMGIAKKTRTPNSWLAWIPIANFYLITQMAKVSGLWTLFLLASFIPIAGGLALFACTIWLFWRIAERIDMPGWTSLLLIIPIVNLVVLGIYAWKK